MIDHLTFSVCPSATVSTGLTPSHLDPTTIVVTIDSNALAARLHLLTDSGGVPATAIRLHAVLTDAITRAGYAHELARPETP